MNQVNETTPSTGTFAGRVGRRVAQVALIASIAGAPLLAAATADAAITTHLSSSCFGVVPVATFVATSAPSVFQAHAGLKCSVNYNYSMQLSQNGVTVASLTTPSGNHSANVTGNVNSKSFVAAPGATYQVVVVVSTWTGGSLGYYTSGAPTTLVSAYDTAKAEAAITWYSNHIGNTSYDGKCELAAETAFGTSGKYPSAIYDWQHNGQGQHTDWQNAPRGTLVFYNTSSNGHVAVSIGGGYVLSTSGHGGGIRIEPVGYFQNPLGWTPSPWR